MEEEKKEKSNFWLSVATFIVNKRKAIMVLTVFALVFCFINFNNVKVNQDITSYLPEDTETRQGLSLMNDQVITYGSARIMLTNITYDDAKRIAGKIEKTKGVKEVSFDDTTDHYKGTYALINVTVNGKDEDKKSIETLNEIKKIISKRDYYISTSIGAVETSSESLDKDMQVILVLAVVIIVVVLFLSTSSYAEIPVLLATFGCAAVFNKGTNFLMGEISFVTNSIAVVLQLALAIDYAIILCDRYMEEHEFLEPVEAVKVALSKAIPEISSSCLTTVSGMVAMMFMQFKLGYDMGIVLVKAIILSLVSVFFVMPFVILLFSKAIDKTKHKLFIPKITFVGKFASFTRFVIPPIFLVVIIASFIMSNKCTYLYNAGSVECENKSDIRIAKEKIDEAFGSSNQLVVMIPKGNYEYEEKILKEYESLDCVKTALGLANQRINDEYILTQKINPRQFAELADLDVEVANFLYSAYAYSNSEYGPVVTGISDYEVPIIDMFLYLYDQYSKGYIKLNSQMDKTLNDLYDTLHGAELQLMGEKYSRIVLDLSLPVEGDETYDAMEDIREIAEKYYDKKDVYLVGESTSCKDLKHQFSTDNIVISVLTLLFVMVILFFTFQSAGLPVLLVATIQGSIWINFTVPVIQNQGVYFIAYLIISAIQMGATIDYAIVISSRYLVAKAELPLKDAITDTINKAFPTIFTSGTILTCAGFLIGNISTDASISAIGIALGRGTLISIILVLFVLPQILLLGDTIIEKTALTINLSREQKEASGRIGVEGHVRGYVQGIIDADVNGTFKGEMKVAVESIIPSKKGRLTEIDDSDIEEEYEEGGN